MASLPPDRLVGRQHELAVAQQLVQDVVGGTAATLLIEGEAGIGKTRLVQSLVDEARECGATVFRGDAHPFEQTRPFGAVAQALGLRPQAADPHRAAIGRLLAGEGQVPGMQAGAVADARYQVVEEVLDLIERACSHTPVAVVLEDLHWADESTLLAFRSMAHSLAHVPFLLVGSLRPVPRSREVDQLLDEALLSGARSLRLHSLTAGEVDDLVHAQLGLAAGPLLASIVAKAGGNPLWVVELLRSLATEGWLRLGPTSAEAAADELPGSLRDLVLRRLRYLPTGTLDLLQVAAVLGDPVSVRDLASVSRRPTTEVVAELGEAFRARLLDEHEDTLVFRHQLVQQAIYEDLPQPVRRALHRDAAGALARSGADLSQVASHVVRGADRGDLEAVRWLRQAAGDAAAGAPSVAVELLRRAGALLPAGHHDADSVAAELAEALLRAGNVAEASTLAEAVLGRPHRSEADVRLRLTLVSALSLQNRTTALIDHAEAALVRCPGLGLADQSLVLAQASYGRTFSGDLTGGEITARRALELGERSGIASMTAWALAALSVAVKAQGRYAEAREVARRAVALAFDPVDNDARLRHPHFFLATALSDSDLVDDARLAYQRAVDECDALGSAWLLPDMLHLSAELRFVMGHWDDALVELESGLHLSEQHGQRILVAQSRAYQAVIAAARGDHRRAGVALAVVQRELTADARCYGAEMVAFAASMLAEASGKPADAYTLLLRFWDYDTERDIRYYHRYLAPPLIRLALTLDRNDVARRVVETVEAGAALAPEVPTVQSVALRCRGLVNHDPEPLIYAVELARSGSRLLDHTGTCEDAAAVLTTVGGDEVAIALLLEAQARYEAVDAAACTARVGAALRRLGVRQGTRGRRRRAATGWASLTPNERAVSQLVAHGLTNREVGRRLHISPHTVNTHLRHVFQKLTVSSRAELAGKVAKQIGADQDHSFE